MDSAYMPRVAMAQTSKWCCASCCSYSTRRYLANKKVVKRVSNCYLFVTCKNCEVATEAALRPYGLNIQCLQEFLRTSKYNPDIMGAAGLAINPDLRRG